MKEITASITGTVQNILVSLSEEVLVGQEVIILESMKMFIPIESSVKGKIVKVKVSIGDFVNEGDVLLVLV